MGAAPRVLTVNTGSSSLKLSLLDVDDDVLAEREVPLEGEVDADALTAAIAEMGQVDAVGHRVVHGGERFVQPTVVDDEVLAALGDLVPLVPTHQPRALSAIRAARRALPGVAHVACFDTAFHATLPAAARTYAVPAAWRALGVRKFGFHGLSFEAATRSAAAELGRAEDDVSLVIAHLGSGGSLCAVRNGISVDTTMGLTPVAGLVMAKRSGDVDPGALAWLVERAGVTPRGLRQGLERESGLAGLCGSSDMREVIARASAGDADASLALDVYVHRVRAGAGQMAGALERIDALVFTGGVGQHSEIVRRRVADGLLGGLVTLVVEAREDLSLARGVRAALSSPG